MKDLHIDLQKTKTYIFLVAGVLLGIALTMAVVTFGRFNITKSNNTQNSATNDPSKTGLGPAPVVDMLKDIDPTKPFVDSMGVEHPPLSSNGAEYVPPKPLTAEELAKVQAPPMGGAAPKPAQEAKVPPTTKVAVPTIPKTATTTQ